jgi:hypothetical protein
MPYPSFYGLLLVAAILPAPYAVGVMLAYGLFRALPIAPASLIPRFAGTGDLSLMVRLRLAGHVAAGLGGLFLAGGLAALALI